MKSRILDRVKMARRLTTDAFDDELNDLIEEGAADLGVVGIDCGEINGGQVRPLIMRAVVTYCCLNFGSPENYDKLKASYDEQKAQLQMATGYGLPEEGAENGL